MGKHLLLGSGAALLLTLTYTWGQISPYHFALFHAVLPVSTITGGVLLDVLIVTLLCATASWVLSRPAKNEHQPWWGLVLAVLCATLVYDIGKLTERPIPWLRPNVIGLVLAAVALAVWRFAPAAYRRVVQGGKLLLTLFGFSIFWVVPQLLYGALHAQRKDIVTFRRATRSTQSPKDSRIVWILFDELSEDQLFDHRAPGLELPNFDRLRNESAAFTALQPVAFYTERVTTSFLLGRTISDVSSDWSGNTLVKMRDTGRWQRFDAQHSIFADAERQGWSTGVAGWFNPYCRMLAGAVDACTWKYAMVWPGHMSQQNSSFHNAAMPILNELRRARHQPSADPSFKEAHLEETTDLVDAAARLISDEQISFVYIHLPIPHPPGVYDRKTATMRPDGSYLDNLAYTDRVLGALRDQIAHTSAAAQTTLLVSSDHAFRIPLWRGGTFWTAEDERATGGHFDPRPVLLIHFPQQSSAATFSQPEHGLILHAILEGLLAGSITDAGSLERAVANAGSK